MSTRNSISVKEETVTIFKGSKKDYTFRINLNVSRVCENDCFFFTQEGFTENKLYKGKLYND